LAPDERKGGTLMARRIRHTRSIPMALGACYQFVQAQRRRLLPTHGQGRRALHSAHDSIQRLVIALAREPPGIPVAA
jgi:hypothetical protein